MVTGKSERRRSAKGWVERTQETEGGKSVSKEGKKRRRER
jgi:hypothetical protein